MEQPDQWLTDLVADTRAGLSRYLARFCASADDVQDVMQEAYLQVYCALRCSGPAGHAPAALLYTTARNLAFSRRRHLKVVAAAVSTVVIGEELRRDQACVEQQASSNQRMQRLLLAVNGLPPKCRDVFVLRMIDGLSQRDIAERLGIAVSTVEKHLARGLRHCKDELLRLETGAASGDPTAESSPAPAGRIAS